MVRMRILHLIRRLDDATAADVVAEQTRIADVTVVYLHDAVYRPLSIGTRTLLLDEDCQARGIASNIGRISYDRLVDFIFENDRVITW
jgi:sulfur transfer complex TusBCD TusB component (DsrH family)